MRQFQNWEKTGGMTPKTLALGWGEVGEKEGRRRVLLVTV